MGGGRTAGIVNLNTRLPFDQNGFRLGFNFELNYGDMAEEVSPTANILVSNTWDTGIGRIGLLANIS